MAVWALCLVPLEAYGWVPPYGSLPRKVGRAGHTQKTSSRTARYLMPPHVPLPRGWL